MNARHAQPPPGAFGPASRPSGTAGTAPAGLRRGDGFRAAAKRSAYSEMARRYTYVAAFDTALREGRLGSPALAIELVAFSSNEAPPHASTVRRWWVRWRAGGRRFESLVARDPAGRSVPHPIIDEAMHRLCPDILRRMPATAVARQVQAEIVRAGELSGFAAPSFTTILRRVRRHRASAEAAALLAPGRIAADHGGDFVGRSFRSVMPFGL